MLRKSKDDCRLGNGSPFSVEEHCEEGYSQGDEGQHDMRCCAASGARARKQLCELESRSQPVGLLINVRVSPAVWASAGDNWDGHGVLEGVVQGVVAGPWLLETNSYVTKAIEEDGGSRNGHECVRSLKSIS